MIKNSKNTDGKDGVSPYSLITEHHPASVADIVAEHRRAISEPGILLSVNVPNWSPKMTGPTNAPSTIELLPAHQSSGSGLQPLAVAVPARCSTQTASGCFGFEPNEETVKSLAAMLLGLLNMTTNGDCIALATLSARKMALDMGVSLDEFERVREAIVDKWLDMNHKSPIMQAFSTGANPHA